MNMNQIDKNTSPEIRAFIYQQLTDLENLLPQGAALSITVEDKSLLPKAKTSKAKTKQLSKKIHTKKVVIYLETSVGNIFVESKNKDVFKAIQTAKEDLKNQLSTLQNILIRQDERANSIETIMRHPYLH